MRRARRARSAVALTSNTGRLGNVPHQLVRGGSGDVCRVISARLGAAALPYIGREPEREARGAGRRGKLVTATQGPLRLGRVLGAYWARAAADGRKQPEKTEHCLTRVFADEAVFLHVIFGSR
jgi:hypothetical protein